MMIQANRFRPTRAKSLGLITNYRCTFRCRHCLYCSAPDIRENPDEETLNGLVDVMSDTLGRVPVHIGGGEPLLHFERMKRVIGKINRSALLLEYVETNGYPLLSRTAEKLRVLQEAGLPCLLVSISPFHNEFVSAGRVLSLLREVIHRLGPDGLFPWHSGYLPFLERACPNRPVPLEEYWGYFGTEEIDRQLNGVMYIHPGGRAAGMLARHVKRYPAAGLLRSPCTQNLASPVHAHIDFRGNYLTGFCSGLRIGEWAALELPRLFEDGLALEAYPVLDMLLKGGLKPLVDLALQKGYQNDDRGYVSSCHLCLDLRVHLYRCGLRFPEFYPDFLYEELAGVPPTAY